MHVWNFLNITDIHVIFLTYHMTIW